MLNTSELSQLRRHASAAVNTGALNRRGGTLLLEVINYYEKAIQSERIQGLQTSDKRPGDDSKRGSSNRSRNPSRKR